MYVCIYPTDKPGKPTGPIKFSDILESSATLSWQPPVSDGGTPVTSYIIEARDTTRTSWVKSGTVTAEHTTFTAERLIEGKSYDFRVIAVNDEGEGESLESKDTVKPERPLCEYEIP